MAVQQFDQRTRNSSFSKISRRRSPSVVAFGSETGDVDVAPVSKARLAAEAAFSSLPSESTPHNQTQITVRRARMALQPLSIEPDDRQPEAKPANKGPRVFRVDALQATVPEREASSPHSVSAAMPGRPKRRQVANQRPGPVVHLVQPLPTRPDDKPSARQLTELAAALASIDPVFQAIERAQAFVFIDGRFADHWRALSERVSALSAELHAPRPATRAGRGRSVRPRNHPAR